MNFRRAQSILLRSETARKLAHAYSAQYWALRGFTGRPPQRFKYALLRQYSTLGYRVFVETGTAYGDMLANLVDSFDRCYSIEADPARARVAVARMAKHPQVKIYQGDSALLLPQVLTELKEPALFWLDAHPSDGERGPVPLLEELRAILEHGVHGHTVIIDDISQLGSLDWPSVNEVKEVVLSSGRCRGGHALEWTLSYDTMRFRLD